MQVTITNIAGHAEARSLSGYKWSFGRETPAVMAQMIAASLTSRVKGDYTLTITLTPNK